MNAQTRRAVGPAGMHRLRMATAVCSVVFIVGTFLQSVAFVDRELIATALMLCGSDPAEAAAAAPGVLTGLRWVGSLYIVGNAVGLGALRGGAATFWTVLAVNATQAAGLLALPGALGRAMLLNGGGAAYVTALVVGAGAALLTVALLLSLAATGRPWGAGRRPRGGGRSRLPEAPRP